jgi:hypothetical protein
MASQSDGVGSALPSQLGALGLYLTSDGTAASWAAVTGLGVTSFGAVGSVPNANGASVSGSVGTLQPADATHPGVVSTAAQTFGGAKTAPSFEATGVPTGGAAVAALGVASTFPGLWLGVTSPDSTNYSLLHAPAFGLFLNSTANEPIGFRTGNVAMAAFVPASAQLDLTGLFFGSTATSIQMKSGNGTAFTLTVSNAGALVIT